MKHAVAMGFSTTPISCHTHVFVVPSQIFHFLPRLATPSCSLATPGYKVTSNNMAPSQLQHRRTHNLLLINKLLSQRDAGSPFTLLLDSLEQSARPLIAEYIRRARVSNNRLISIAIITHVRELAIDHQADLESACYRCGL